MVIFLKSHKRAIYTNLRLSDCIRNFLLEMEIGNLASGSIHNSGLTLGEIVAYGERMGWSDFLEDLDRDRMVGVWGTLISEVAAHSGWAAKACA